MLGVAARGRPGTSGACTRQRQPEAGGSGDEADRGSPWQAGDVAPMSVRRAEGESFVPLSYCLFTPLLLADPGGSPFTTPPPPPHVHGRQAQQGARSLDAAGPFSPACGPIGILRRGKDSWRPGLDAPLFRTPTAAKREAGALKASRGLHDTVLPLEAREGGRTCGTKGRRGKGCMIKTRSRGCLVASRPLGISHGPWTRGRGVRGRPWTWQAGERDEADRGRRRGRQASARSRTRAPPVSTASRRRVVRPPVLRSLHPLDPCH